MRFDFLQFRVFLSGCVGRVGDGAVELLLGNGFGFHEPGVASNVGIESYLLSREGLRLGHRLIDLSLEGTRVKLKEQLSFTDDLAVLETDFLNVAAHSGPDFDFFRRP